MSKLPVLLRDYDPATDRNWVFKAWISSFRSSDYAGIVPEHVWFDFGKVVINMLLKRGMRITVATSPDDRDQLLGFIAFEPGPILHYCFVKDFVRRQGVATLLLASANFAPGGPVVCTFRTADARHLGRIDHRPVFARRRKAYDPSTDGPLHG